MHKKGTPFNCKEIDDMNSVLPWKPQFWVWLVNIAHINCSATILVWNIISGVPVQSLPPCALYYKLSLSWVEGGGRGRGGERGQGRGGRREENENKCQSLIYVPCIFSESRNCMWISRVHKCSAQT